MGFVIFEQSGTFIPSNYGLVTGDPIQVVVVGGGGGGTAGGYLNSTGGAGGTSSFGNYFTAAGGARGGAPMPSSDYAFMLRSFAKLSSATAATWYTYCIYVPSMGEDGWLPNGVVPFNIAGLCATLLGAEGPGNGAMQLVSENRLLYVSDGGQVGIDESGARTDKRGGYSYAVAPAHNQNYGSNTTVLFTAGVPGFGYGAGGAGSPNANGRSNSTTTYNSYQHGGKGGGAGKVTYGAMVLPSTANIAVTVGNGGNGDLNYRGSSIYAGGGARGCVAVFW